MPAARLDITAEQGSTFKLWMEYKYRGGTAIDLSNFTAAMQVRKSQYEDNMLLFFSTNGLTAGGSTGQFISGYGITGIGGISLNTSISATSGKTGGILIRADANSMKNVPAGKHFYDLELTNSLGEVMRLVEGSFTVPREITR